ncbi:MAG TPA: ABC transporter permease [Aestuariivirgaceae bacterium]|nr:ABC transporter permease [Aestuariivirgaceae bacterium]
MTMSAPGRTAVSSSGLWRDVWRMALFTVKRVLALLLTVLIGVYLTILIANMGGKVDELRLVQIRSTAAEQVRADPAFFDLPAEERNELIERRVKLDVERLRLDQPFIWRSFDYLNQAMRLDLGRAEHMHSDRGARDVYWIIVERLPATLLLFGTANFLIFFTSVFVALSLSRRYGSVLDRSVIALAPSSAAPGWFYGIFLILIFAFLIPILPPGGLIDIPPPEGTLAYGLSVLRHMALPVTAMFISTIFISIYSWRTFFLIHSSEDYVEMARAKGLPSRLIERRYILRPTLSPIITSFALMLIGLWSGAIILEQVFNWPGLGTLLFQAIGHRDTPVIIGSVVIFAYLLALTVFVLDILYAVLDPRVRVGPG